MSDNQNWNNHPKLSFLPVEKPSSSMEVYEVALAGQGAPPAPFKASRWTVEPGGESPVDSHSVHEMWLVADGEGELVYDNRALPLRAGDIYYFEPPKPHLARNTGTETLVVFSVWWSA